MTDLKRFIVFLLLVAAASCIDPYVPNLKNYKSLLVVEGLITNENSSYKIKLDRTTSREDSDPEKVTDANVYIIDGNGIRTDLKNNGDGYYTTDSTSFRGIIGQKYTLQILTSDGEEYSSEECTMLPVAGIDTLYYEKGEEITGNLGESVTGLKIFLNSTDFSGMNQYFRWSYEEVWKFIVPNAQQNNYIFINDTTFSFPGVPFIKNVCYRKNLSGDIITSSNLSGETNIINKQLINFIDPLKSDRLTKEYSILVKQYSVSKKEYEFWNNLKKAGEAGGDIFASQPYTVISNIHNVNSPGEMVPGYFEVSAVSQKRIFITAREIDPLDLPHYQTECVEIAKSPQDYPLSSPPVSFNEIYHGYTDGNMYTFVKPILKPGVVAESRVYSRDILQLVFSTKKCAICELPDFSAKPDFWIDLE